MNVSSQSDSAGIESRTEREEDILAEAMQVVFDALATGQKVDRSALLQQYPTIAEDLTACLDNVDFIERIAPQFTDRDIHAPSESFQPLATLGDFRIVRELGRGGMGVVYEAEQLSIGRKVALKVLPFAAILDESRIQRFKNEARAAGTLDHSHIVPVLSVGEERGVYYYAMSLVEGQSVAELIDELRRTEEKPEIGGDGETGQEGEKEIGRGGDGENTLKQTQAAISTKRASRNTPEYYRTVANVGMRAAEALHYAHENGVVHRDIKPANLLLDTRGKVWITDFGLARLDKDAAMTMTGDLIGTLRYMSPEQALGKRVLVGHHSDIYSLGATLYELLTLRPTFDGENREELLKQIAFDEPPKLRQLKRSIPAELETIVLKAIAKSPDERYATAAELADDLCAYLEHRPIKAKPPTVAQRVSKWGQRRPALVMSAAILLVMLCIGLAIGALLINRQKALATAAAQDARQQQQLAEENYQIALEAVDKYYHKVSEHTLLNQPGMLPLRQELLEMALEYYQKFAEKHEGDADLQVELALNFHRVGVIQNATGKKQEALGSLLQSISIRRQLAQLEPANEVDHKLALAISLKVAANIARQAGLMSHAEALDWVNEAKTILETNSAYLVTPEQRYVQVKVLGDRGTIFSDIGQYKEAHQDYHRSLEIAKEIVADYPDLEMEYSSGLAAAYNNLALFESPAKAVPLYIKSIEILERLVEHSRDQNHRLNLAIALMNLARNANRLGDHETALDSAERSLDRHESLVAQYPAAPGFKSALAKAYLTFNRNLKNLVDTPIHEEYRRKATEMLRDLVVDYPDVPVYKRALAEIFRPEAYEEAVVLYEELLTSGSATENDKLELGLRHSGLGRLLSSGYDAGQARIHRQRARELLEAISTDGLSFSERISVQMGLGFTAYEEGKNLYYTEEKREQAAPHFRKAIVAFTSLDSHTRGIA